MFVNNNKWPQAKFPGKTLYYYNRLIETHIGMKLSTQTYYVTPMTHTNGFHGNNQQQTALGSFL